MVQGYFIYDDNMFLYLSYGLQRKFRQTTDISFESVVVKGIMLLLLNRHEGGTCNIMSLRRPPQKKKGAKYDY